MKRLFGFVVAAMIASSVFAGPFSDLGNTLSSLDSSQTAEISGKLPEGRDILPILWKYAFEEQVYTKTVLGFFVVFKSMNPTENVYVFDQAVVFKFGVGLQRQDSRVVVKQNGQTFTVQTKGMSTYNVDSEGNRKTSPVQNPPKSCNANSKNIAGELEKNAKSLSADDYKKWSDEAYYNLLTQTATAATATNKLKAKKWYSTYNMEDQRIKGRILVGNIDESKKQGFAYMVQGIAMEVDVPKDTIVNFYTNNDSFVDAKAGDILEISGVCKEVKFLELPKFCIGSVIVEE